MPRVSITIPDKNPQPYRFNLDHKKVTIGRSKDSDIIIDEPSVSGLHATMERVEGGYILRDRGSTNGITLDDKLMEIIDLRNGDDVKVGDSVFDYHLTEDEQDVLDEEEFNSHEKVKKEGASSDDEDDDDEDDDNEDDDWKEETPAPKKKAPKKKVVSKKPMMPQPAPQAMAASPAGGGNFLSGLAAFILGALAFFLGVSRSYEKAEEKMGRENVSLLKDMKEGKPPSVTKQPDGVESDESE